MQKDKQFYDSFFTRYPVSVHDHSPRFLAVVQLLSGKCLDVACGTGTLSKYYAGDYTGVDISDVAIKKAKEERRKTAHFFVADFAKDAFVLKEKFDCAYLGEFLEHIADDSVVFSNLKDLLKDDARVVVSVPNGNRVPDESHCRIFTCASIRRDYSKYGKISFHTWEGFEDRILFSIDFGKPNIEEITLVMICKDEALGIEKSIISALPLVDRVVVSVDDATTDKTKEIAEMYADELRMHTWASDFSKARNEASVNVKSRWTLFLDGHEYIESLGAIREKMKLDVDGIFVTIRMENGMTFIYPRIYRTGLQFKNAVHNLVEPKTKTAEPRFVIVHDRDNLQAKDAIERRNKQREEMMPRLLKEQIKKNPNSARAYFHLANFYQMQGDLKHALKCFKKVIAKSYFHDEVYMAYMNVGRIRYENGQYIRSLFNFNRADALIPDRWETARALGGFYYLQGHYKRALPLLVRALGGNKRHYMYEPMQKNLADTWDMIANCFYKLSRFEESFDAWTRASEIEIDPEKIKFFKHKASLVRRLSGKSEEPPVKIPVEDRNDEH